MSEQKTNSPARLLWVITGTKMGQKLEELLVSRSLPVLYKTSGTGTATSEMMDLLGLGTAEKSVIIALLPKATAHRALVQINDLLQEVERKNRGIAFTVPLTGATKLLARLMNRVEEETGNTPAGKEESPMADKNHTLITAIVNQGYSEEVMNSARAAGARGGTVLHTRRIADGKAAASMGLSVQEEREMILIVADEEHKLQIMQAIGDQWGVTSQAQGVVLSLPIDEAIGLA